MLFSSSDAPTTFPGSRPIGFPAICRYPLEVPTASEVAGLNSSIEKLPKEVQATLPKGKRDASVAKTLFLTHE